MTRLDSTSFPVLGSIRGSKVAVRGRLASPFLGIARPPSALPTFPRKMRSACGAWGRGMALDPCCATEVWSGESLVLGLGDCAAGGEWCLH